MNHKLESRANLMNHKLESQANLMNHKLRSRANLMNHKLESQANLMNHKLESRANLMNHKLESLLSQTIFSPLDSGGPGLLDEVLGGIGDVFPGDSAGDPMEEIPDKRMPSRTRNDECLRGLSEEEFKRLFDEVGMAKHFQTIYLVQPLRTRTAAEVTAAVQQTVLRLKAEGLRISRIHADRARELRVESIKRWALERGIFCTFAEGQAPQSNGRAESAVKWVKSSVRKLLAATDLPKETWAVAAHYATQDRMERMLRRSSSMLPFGTKVHVRSKVYGTGGKYDLDSRWKAGRYVGPSLEVNGGHMIRFENGAYMTSTHLRPHLVHPDTVVDLEEYEVLLPVPTRRLKIKAGGRDADGSSEHEAISLEYDPEHPAEQHAMRLLEDSDNLTPDQLENLAIMLPSTAPTPKRFGPQRDSQKVWTAGAFVHGGVIGVKTASTRVFIKYVNQLEPGHHFNAVAVTTDIEAKQHVDARNVGMNLVAGLSYFKGGALVVEGPEEERVLSLDGDTAHQVFDPKFKHSTKPWYGGSRIVLIAYSVRDSGNLKEHHVKYLKDLGFDWVPHFSKPIETQEEIPVLKTVRVGLLDATRSAEESKKLGDDPDRRHGDDEHGSDDEPKERRAHKDSLLHVTHDVELAIGDLEDRASRLRDLLEEEEIMSEEYRRLGQTSREALSDVRDQVSEFLEQVHEELLGLERFEDYGMLEVYENSDRDGTGG